ncbi:MAG: oligopeptide/dipeptide ABC transporter ATP-binding protein, partial [Brachybacterium sp.]
VAQLAHRVTVMYAGQVIEQGIQHELLTDPRHEYTRGLLGSVLSIEAGAERLHQVPGTVPSPRDFAAGDRFAPRSLDPSADPTAHPRLVEIGMSGHLVATTGTVPTPLAGDPR